MDSGFRTPLLDFFRRGDVARDIRLQAAQGAMAPRAHEQIGLLMLLVGDQDPEIAAAAEATVAAIPREAVEAFLARSDASGEMRDFFAARGIQPAEVPWSEVDKPLIEAALPEGDLPLPADPLLDGEVPPEGQERESTLQKIAGLTVAQRMALAMKGSREERAILIRDPNKIVGVAVLSSPKINEAEVETIAKMTSLSEELLRMIAFSRAWTKNYGVIHALVKNPKTPLAVSINFLSRLNDKDLRAISSNRNVADALRITARKKLVIDK
jgi:hypothetical protein